MGSWVVSKDWWDSLPAEYQEAISKAAVDAQAEVAPMLAEVDAASLAETVAKGATVHVVTDKQPWIDRMEPVWAKFAPEIPARRIRSRQFKPSSDLFCLAASSALLGSICAVLQHERPNVWNIRR